MIDNPNLNNMNSEKSYPEDTNGIKPHLNILTVESLIEKLKFAVENGYIMKDHKILVCGSEGSYFIENICSPSLVLGSGKGFKKAQMTFVKM